MRRPRVRAEVARIERDESALLDAMLKARQEAGLTQAQVAERMGTQAPAVARLERALATRKHSPSVATVRNMSTHAESVWCCRSRKDTLSFASTSSSRRLPGPTS